jgi:pimeloyl-ACP methyl ester carboxylesterase
VQKAVRAFEEAEMEQSAMQEGLAPIHGAELHYQMAGEGRPLVLIHAGVADSRQWDQDFPVFAEHYRVLRYDLRGYGRSEPVAGEFSHLADLTALLRHLELEPPYVMLGCSMGGGLAMDYALANPGQVDALVMVDSGPSGLELDVPQPDAFGQAEQAYKAGDLDLVAELETQIWFDGMNRSPDQVNPHMRDLLVEMNRLALDHDAKGLGKRQPDTAQPAFERLAELDLPVLILVGDQDIPYMLAAAEYMQERLPVAQTVIVRDAAHLPNMDHPVEFQRWVLQFLRESLPEPKPSN